MWTGEQWIPAPPKEDSSMDEITAIPAQEQSLDLRDSVVGGDINQNINVNQEKVVHGLNIEKIVISQSLIDAVGMQGASAGITDFFGSNTEIEVSDDLSDLKSAILSKIDMMLDEPRGEISEDRMPRTHLSYREQAQIPGWGDRKVGGLTGMAPGCINPIQMVHHLEKLKSDVSFLSFGQSFMTPLIEMPTLAVTHGSVDHITLMGYNALKKTVIVGYTYGNYEKEKTGFFEKVGGMISAELGVPTGSKGHVEWVDFSSYCSITLDEFADFYVGTQHFMSTSINWGRRQILFQQ